ncbi:ATP-binding cassette sub-family C member 4-like [Neodiprion virginianus]|uniref:ATP-binding cassette sub-family C member 4-like n=1 Tax=Neodiprion virginianus TaxID=2961670 RepID=UPI001EE78046|nr:ATP-binding cassette sub-family C member 4-like [Neodiprion virginianus]
MNTNERDGKKCPEETSNILSNLFFWWMVPIFRKGAKSNLQITDLCDPPKFDESEGLGDRLEREWRKELKRSSDKSESKPSLFRALCRAFWVPFLLRGAIIFCKEMMACMMVPVLQGKVISYFDPGQKLMDRQQALIYAGLLVLLTLVNVLIDHNYYARTFELGMRFRVACSALMYRKVLRLNQSSFGRTAEGQITNLISNDVARFDIVLPLLNFIWIVPMQVLLLGYMMWQFVGEAALVGIGVMIMQTMPVQGYLSHIAGILRAKIAVKTDERVQLMSELVSGIQVVKMYSWEKPFQTLVSKTRALEIKLIRYTSYLNGILMGITVFSDRVTLFLTLVTFVLSGNTLNAKLTYTLATLFNLLQLACAFRFPMVLIMIGEARVTLERITKFLLLDEVEPSKESEFSADNGRLANEKYTINETRLQNGNRTEMESLLTNRMGYVESSGKLIIEKTKVGEQIERGVEIEMVNVFANWVHDQLPPTLHEVSLKIKRHSLSVLVGPVGSGKSSLLHLLLGELSVRAGGLSLFSGENSEKTKIGRRDIRISYASQNPWIFPATIRENIIFGQSYDKKRYQKVTEVCALVRDFAQLPQGDLSQAGEKGVCLSGGQKARVNLARALYREADLYLLDDPLSAVDSHVGNHLFKECIQEFLKNKTRILVTHQLQYLRQADTVIVLNRGTVKCQGTYEELAQMNLDVLASKQLEESDEPKQVKNTDEENMEDEEITSSVNDQATELSQSKENLEDVDEEEIVTGRMTSEVYKRYFLAGGNPCSLIFITATIIIAQVTANTSDYWLTYWTNQDSLRSVGNNTSCSNHTRHDDQETQWFDKYGLLRRNVAIYVYTAIIVTCVFFLLLRSIFCVRVCMNASCNLHNYMFENLLRAPMKFFNANPSGRILNRFSKDVGVMDEQIPRTLIDVVQTITLTMGIFAMVAIINPWTIIPVIISGVIFYVIRIYYLRTARDIKRLEGVVKSPVFTHIKSTLDGLTTIRSGGPMVGEMLRKEFDQIQNVHSGAWYLIIIASSAFGLVLDLVSSSYMAFVCFAFILIDNGNILGGSVGLVISQSLTLNGMVQWGIRRSTELVSQMVSVERLLQYTDIPKEGPFTTDKPPPTTWPSNGGLVFKGVSMKYAEDKPPVLRDLTVTIEPGWKIGIVGRTGAGKSSLVSALFRLNGDGLDGEILLDGINTKSIGLHELRPHISIIPQEPILFSASLRYNLDPFNEYSDDELWDSLREVELGDTVQSLDFKVAEGGSNFSVGQRQLICLARAIIRNKQLLILDEATANIDRSTDELIQNTIKRKFAHCTVLTIAHRLNTIMDSDRVLVMEEGCIVEFGPPHLLLKNQNGQFFQMLQQTGTATAAKLSQTAERSYFSNSKCKKVMER